MRWPCSAAFLESARSGSLLSSFSYIAGDHNKGVTTPTTTLNASMRKFYIRDGAIGDHQAQTAVTLSSEEAHIHIYAWQHHTRRGVTSSGYPVAPH